MGACERDIPVGDEMIVQRHLLSGELAAGLLY